MILRNNWKDFRKRILKCHCFILIATLMANQSCASIEKKVPSLTVTKANDYGLVLNKEVKVSGFFSLGPNGYVITEEKYSGVCVSIAKTPTLLSSEYVGTYQFRTALGVFIARPPVYDGYTEHGGCGDENEATYFLIDHFE